MVNDQVLLDLLNSMGVGGTRCVDDYDLEALVDKLRDLLRWRDSFVERPPADGPYLVMSAGSEFPIVNYWHSDDSGWTVGDWRYWRPIGPLPGDG